MLSVPSYFPRNLSLARTLLGATVTAVWRVTRLDIERPLATEYGKLLIDVHARGTLFLTVDEGLQNLLLFDAARPGTESARPAGPQGVESGATGRRLTDRGPAYDLASDPRSADVVTRLVGHPILRVERVTTVRDLSAHGAGLWTGLRLTTDAGQVWLGPYLDAIDTPGLSLRVEPEAAGLTVAPLEEPPHPS